MQRHPNIHNAPPSRTGVFFAVVVEDYSEVCKCTRPRRVDDFEDFEKAKALAELLAKRGLNVRVERWSDLYVRKARQSERVVWTCEMEGAA